MRRTWVKGHSLEDLRPEVPMDAADVARELEHRDVATIRTLLSRLCRERRARRVGWGRFCA